MIRFGLIPAGSSAASREASVGSREIVGNLEAIGRYVAGGWVCVVGEPIAEAQGYEAGAEGAHDFKRRGCW